MQHICALCNETIEEVLVQFGDVQIVDEEYWHLECFAEYFDGVLEEVV